ncbi:hypothetical protein GGR56DRAFT_489489 [Xylariaceae sp. FL0804]|nr:hypothetical protein GGR56DRAFT_489489 [Xylariaceae sp. FL0804]
MVYCGKPSRGCQMCRDRRIKCDETKPTCRMCAKSRRHCPGYKDEFDLVFRNETKATERRARKANRRAAMYKPPRQTSLSSDSPPTAPALSAFQIGSETPVELAVMPALSTPVEQKASCHFASNFVLMPREGTTHGFLEFVVPLLKQDAVDGPLQHAFNACSMAFLYNRAGPGNNLHEQSIYEYSEALTKTNAALRDVEAQKSDTTLAAVLLLGLYESISARQIGSLNWGSHTEGAIQLVKLRGRKQLRTKTGVQIFVAVRTQMIIHSLTSGRAPIMGTEWWLTDAVKDPFAANSQRLMIKTGEIRAEVTRLMNNMTRTPDNVEIMLDMVRKAQTVDQEVLTWMRDVPDDWGYTTVAWEDQVPNGGDYARADVFPGRVDVYRDFWIASIWNSARTVRLILASLIVRCAAWVCSPVDYRTTPEYATAARTCVDMITDIIASVPYQLGWRPRDDAYRRRQQPQPPQQQKKPNLGGFACGDEEASKGLAGYFLAWPLTCVNGQDYTTDAQRAWVLGRLHHIADVIGVKYAHVLTHLQVRIPSMLIRRDGLMASPYGPAHNFEKLVSARLAPPLMTSASASSSSGGVPGGGPGGYGGYALNPLQQREAMHKEHLDRQKADLLAKAGGGAGPGSESEIMAKRLLKV